MIPILRWSALAALLALSAGCGGQNRSEGVEGSLGRYKPIDDSTAPFWDRQTTETAKLLQEIADEFNASLTATLLKLADTDHFPIVIVCHNKQRRRWFRRAPMVPGWWFPRNDLDPESFAFETLYDGTAESSYPRKIGADAWFEFRNVDRYEIQEQSFLLPNEEILTLLILPEEGLD